MKTAAQLKIGDCIIDQEGIDWKVTEIKPVGRLLEITFHNPMLIMHTTVGKFRRSASFETPAAGDAAALRWMHSAPPKGRY